MITRGAIVAVSTLDSIKAFGEGPARFSPWYGGPIGWVLRGTIALPTPVPCRGAQGLWDIPQDALDNIRDQLAHLDECREEPL